jgi:hypothetical protein
MKKWWHHHKRNVPFCDSTEKARLEDLTGCIPLLLQPLCGFAGIPYGSIEKTYRMNENLIAVHMNIFVFYQEKYQQDDYEV